MDICPDIEFHISTFLEAREVLQLTKTSKENKIRWGKDDIWKKLTAKDFSDIKILRYDNNTYKSAYLTTVHVLRSSRLTNRYDRRTFSEDFSTYICNIPLCTTLMHNSRDIYAEYYCKFCSRYVCNKHINRDFYAMNKKKLGVRHLCSICICLNKKEKRLREFKLCLKGAPKFNFDTDSDDSDLDYWNNF